MHRSLFAAVALLAMGAAQANCSRDGVASQAVSLTVEDRQVDRWEVTSSEIHRVRLPQGFELGLRIEPATPAKYRELLEKTRMRAIDELVKITLFDMSTQPPQELSTTWGGANSRQGFGPRGGANGVPKMVDQVLLWFHKPACVTAGTIANGAQ